MDDDTRDFLRAQVATEVGLPDGWSDRLSGDSVTEATRFEIEASCAAPAHVGRGGGNRRV
jgi:hypothetical protein